MPRLVKKRKHMRTIGSEGGRAKKPCDSPESRISTSNTNENNQNDQHAEPNYSATHLSPPRQIGDDSSGTIPGPSRSTVWRRAQKVKELERKRIEQEQQSQVDAESNWEDIEKLVEEKWPIVAREIRATVLTKGMISLLSVLEVVEKYYPNS